MPSVSPCIHNNLAESYLSRDDFQFAVLCLVRKGSDRRKGTW